MPRRKSSEPKISELKKELKALRAKECPPISKMKKEAVKAEIERMKHREESLKKPYEEKNVLRQEKALEQLRGVESEVKERNKEVKQKRSTTKALEGLRQVEAETKERNLKRKMDSNKKEKKSNEEEEISKLSTLENLSEKEKKKRMAIFETFTPKMKENVINGYKKYVGKDVPLEDIIRSVAFRESLELKNSMTKNNMEAGFSVSEQAKKEYDIYNDKKSKKGKKEEDSMSVSDVEEVKKSPSGKKPKFAKGSKEAKEYMASLRAKKGK